MKVIIHENDNSIKQFLAMFVIGVVSSLKEKLITVDDAWNWILNLFTMKCAEQRFGEKDKLYNAIHLGTELEDVESIIPQHFQPSCDEIIELCKTVIKESQLSDRENDYYLRILDEY